MSPATKIANTISKCQHILESINCPYCNNNRCWKHGHYIRKGFHSKAPENGWILRTIQRFICCEVSCKHTFSVLPDDVLPYCRFLWKDLLEISRSLYRGETAYHIARYHWNLPLRIILHTKGIITRVHQWLAQLCRQTLHAAARGFETLATTVLTMHSWFVFCRMWFHHIYPSRIGKNLNPHNLGIKPT